MKDLDEPLLDGFKMAESSSDPRVRDRIRALLSEQPFAVLCTQGEGQPYGSVIAYAASPDLLALSFATPVATRKYRLLCACDRVALVVDSRSKFPHDMTQVEAITATGRAVELSAGTEHEGWLALLTARHPQLRSFFIAPSSALFRIDVVRYLHVSRFQEVHQWIPQSGG